MGQRHQIYIRIENPLKKEEISGAIYKDKKDKIKDAEIYFGKGKYSIIPFHHQWLYGGTAVGMLVGIMKKVHEAKGEKHPFSPDLKVIPYSSYSSREKKAGYGLIELIEALISVTDLDVSEITGRFGVENLTYIGDEHYDYEKGKVNKKYGNHQKHCDYGDNNDGIMIIDVPSKKYCFMNISDFEEQSGSVHSLPKLEPVSALEYFKAYYPTEKTELSDYVLKGNSEEKINKKLECNKDNLKALEPILKQFNVISLAEVKKIFPATYKEFEEEKKKKLAKAIK